MPDLDFIPHDPPQSDFVIVTNDTEVLHRRLTAIGAKRRRYANYSIYTWNYRLSDRFIVGIGVVDGNLLIGPRNLRRSPTEIGTGSYTIVDCNENSSLVRPDPFGMNTVYYSDCIITNRLHLAALIVREIDADSALASFYNEGGYSFSLNMFQTAISGVKLAPAGASLSANNYGITLNLPEDDYMFDESNPDEYWELIERGASEIVSNVEAVIDAGFPVYADLTGGRDSRLIFGALVAAGKQEEVVFNTLTNTATPGLVADLEVATGLVAAYGGRYDDRPRSFGYSQYTVSQNLRRRRSQIFGTYHWLVPTDIRPVATLNRTQTIKLLGGGGELYRDYWHPLLFNSVDATSIATPDDTEAMLVRHAGPYLGHNLLPSYQLNMVHSIMSLPGRTMGSKLDSHYLNFRNRYHFGPRQSLPESLSTLNPAMSRSLLHAARSLPASERSSGRVLFDVTRALDEKLAYLPYESPNDPSIFRSGYHRRSRYDDTQLTLEPAIHLANIQHDNRNYLRPIRPGEPDWDYEGTLRSEIFASVDLLKANSSQFSHILGQELDNYVDWALQHSLRSRQALASKLRALADYEQIVS